MRISIAFLLVIGSAATANAAGATKPTDRARTFVQAQLDAMTKGEDEKVRGTFSADAVLIGDRFDSSQPITKMTNIEFAGALMNGSPHSVLKKSTIKSIVAGGDDTFVCLTAELVTTYNSHEPEEKPRSNLKEVVRLTEIIAADGQTWKSVVAVFDHPSATMYNIHAPELTLANKTKAGSLAALIASPADLVKSLASDKNLFVLGTDTPERAIGPAAAKKLLSGWSKLGLKLYGDVREVQATHYAFAMSGVEFTKPDKSKDKQVDHYAMLALIIAVPDGSNWKVVGVHYANN